MLEHYKDIDCNLTFFSEIFIYLCCSREEDKSVKLPTLTVKSGEKFVDQPTCVSDRQSQNFASHWFLALQTAPRPCRVVKL